MLYRLKEANVALTRCGLGSPSDHLAERSSLRSLAGHRPRISFEASSLANKFYLISCLEQSAVAQHGVHDDRKTSIQCDASLLETPALGDLHGLSLQREALPASGKDRVRSLVEQPADCAVSLSLRALLVMLAEREERRCGSSSNARDSRPAKMTLAINQTAVR